MARTEGNEATVQAVTPPSWSQNPKSKFRMEIIRRNNGNSQNGRQTHLDDVEAFLARRFSTFRRRFSSPSSLTSTGREDLRLLWTKKSCEAKKWGSRWWLYQWFARLFSHHKVTRSNAVSTTQKEAHVLNLWKAVNANFLTDSSVVGLEPIAKVYVP